MPSILEDRKTLYGSYYQTNLQEQKYFLAGLPDLLTGRLAPARYRERLTMLLYAEEHAEEQELADQAVESAEMWIETGKSTLKIRYKLSLFYHTLLLRSLMISAI